MRFIIFLMVLLFSASAMAGDNSVGAGSADDIPGAVARSVSSVPVVGLSIASAIDVHVKGLIVTRGQQRHVTQIFSERIVKEAKEVLSVEENKWMPLHMLLGIAISETDLQYWRRSGHDCGLCQNNVAMMKMTYASKERLCKQLKKDTKLSMEIAMRELNAVRTKYCTDEGVAKLKKWYRGSTSKITDIDRWECILNVYNQGPRYFSKTWYKCSIRWYNDRESGTIGQVETAIRQCFHRNRYWLRTYCFAEGVRMAKKPMVRYGSKMVQGNCRYAYSIGWIQKAYSW